MKKVPQKNVTIWRFFPIIGLLLIFHSYRLFHLSYPILDAFNFRQTQTATFALNIWKHGLPSLQTQLDIFGIGKERFLTLEFPLYEMIVAVFYRIFGVTDAWGRVVTILSGYFAAWYLFLIVKLITKNRILALLSPFFFLAIPLNMFYQRTFMIDPTIVFFLLAGLYHGCHALINGERREYIIAIAFLSFGFIQKGLYGPFWLLPLVSLKFFKNGFRSLFAPSFLALILIPLGVLLVWQNYVNQMNTLSSHGYFSTTSTAHLEWNFGTWADRLSISLWKYRMGQVINGLFLKPGLLVFVLGLWFLRRYDKYWVFTAFLLSQILYFIVVFRIQAQNYYQLVMVPAVAVLLAIGLYGSARVVTGWMKKPNRKIVFAALVSIFCSVFLWRSWGTVQASFFIDWDWYRQIAKLKDVTESGSYGIFATAGNEWNSAYTYYSNRILMQKGSENLTEEAIDTWRTDGYSFIVLHDPNAHASYLSDVKPGHNLDLLQKYPLILDQPLFRVYKLK